MKNKNNYVISAPPN